MAPRSRSNGWVHPCRPLFTGTAFGRAGDVEAMVASQEVSYQPGHPCAGRV